MDLSLKYQPTPNPNALIFHCPKTLTDGGCLQFQKDSENMPPLAEALFALPGVETLLLDGTRLTLTKIGTMPWGELLPEADRVLSEALAGHRPIPVDDPPENEENREELKKINELIDLHIRPYLQNDGGDLSLLALKGNVLSIRYMGACGSCPAAFGGTLLSIRQVLQKHYREDLQVVPV